jgi:hypothetical protein
MEEPRYYWRVRTRLAERFGQSCRVLMRGRMNTVVVEFEDGVRVATSRWYVRKKTKRRAQENEERSEKEGGTLVPPTR